MAAKEDSCGRKPQGCIFCKIAAKEVEGTRLVYEDEQIAAFPDRKPAAKHHYLVVPKEHYGDPKSLHSQDHVQLLERLFEAGKKSLVENQADCEDALFGYHWPPFNSVQHLHLHVISPRSQMGFFARQIYKSNSLWKYKETMEGLVKVFVYGTLKKGFANHHYLQNGLNRVAKFITTGLTKESFPLVIGTDEVVPCMLPLKGQGKQVQGEIYEVDSNVLSSLDELEGHPTWYKRTPCEIITTEKAAGIEAGDVISCLAYFLIDFTEEFLSKEFLSEYTLEHQLASIYIGPSSRM